MIVYYLIILIKTLLAITLLLLFQQGWFLSTLLACLCFILLSILMRFFNFNQTLPQVTSLLDYILDRVTLFFIIAILSLKGILPFYFFLIVAAHFSLALLSFPLVAWRLHIPLKWVLSPLSWSSAALLWLTLCGTFSYYTLVSTLPNIFWGNVYNTVYYILPTLSGVIEGVLLIQLFLHLVQSHQKDETFILH